MNEQRHPLAPRVLADIGEFAAELLKVVLISLAIILPVRYYVVQPFYVKGASMEPTFYDNEYLLIDELTYRFSPPARGDVVVFRYPRDPSQFFIKRIIGLPKETVSVNDGVVSIVSEDNPNSLVLNEEYLDHSLGVAGDYSVTVPSGHYFLMGDNRSSSLDSRVFGPVPERYLIGRVLVRAWPMNRWTVFSHEAVTP